MPSDESLKEDHITRWFHRNVDGPHSHYTAPRAFPAEGSRIALQTCMRCGAALVLDPDDPNPREIHDAWHEALKGGVIANSDADARLIAAASDLLEALMEFQRADKALPPVSRPGGFMKARIKARAAIAKALKGEGEEG